MKVLRTFAGAAALMLAASALQAQAHSHGNHGAAPAAQQAAPAIPAMLKGLDLTPQQTARVIEIHDAHHSEMKALKDSSAEVKSAAKERGHAAIRAILEPAQQAKFDEMMKSHGKAEGSHEGHGAHAPQQQGGAEGSCAGKMHAADGSAGECCCKDAAKEPAGEKKGCCEKMKEPGAEKKPCCEKMNKG
jgi:Spy/CpxP family protein refolding chaperone